MVERGASDVTSLRIVTRVSQGPTTQGIWSLSPGGVVVERRSSDVTSLRLSLVTWVSTWVSQGLWSLSPGGVVVERRASYDTSLTYSVAAMKIDK